MRSNKGLKILQILIFPSVFILWAFGVWIAANTYKIPSSISEAGQFGDSFGLINTLFSGLAFAAVVFTIIQQFFQARQDRNINSQQMFEASFFEMNRIAREAKATIRIIYPDGRVFQGIDAANELRRRFVEEMDKKHPSWRTEDPTMDEIRSVFGNSVESLAMFWEFIAFFAIISSELSFLECRPRTGVYRFDEEVKDRLLEIVRASLDSSTLAIMLLYGLSNDEITQKIIRYNLAKYMNRGEVWKLCKPYYPYSKYKIPTRDKISPYLLD